jgi:hypothetical protein
VEKELKKEANCDFYVNFRNKYFKLENLKSVFLNCHEKTAFLEVAKISITFPYLTVIKMLTFLKHVRFYDFLW